MIIRTLNWSVKRRIPAWLAFGLLLLLLPFGILYLMVDGQSQLDEARKVDALIVLGSAVWPGERPSPSLAARTRHAIALFRAGYARRLILCGGLGQNPPAEAEAMRRIAIAAGVPAEALVLDDTSHSTEENLAHAWQIMQARGWKSALIVSDPFHLLRAKLIAADLGIEAYGSPASDSPTYTNPSMRIWYTAREAAAVVWYYGTRTLGEPMWLYALLKRFL
jgi:uncharacterized SAM-binding protein YcdF (DUF218 family)